MDPTDGFAKIHYGFILKTHDNDLEGCVKWLTEGIASEAEGTRDGKFYFHLGDAYQRLNQTENVNFMSSFGYSTSLCLVHYLELYLWHDPIIVNGTQNLCF